MEVGTTFQARCLDRHFVLDAIVRSHLHLRWVSDQPQHHLHLHVRGQNPEVPNGGEPRLRSGLQKAINSLKYEFKINFAIIAF
jgi:hypothetical protein